MGVITQDKQLEASDIIKVYGKMSGEQLNKRMDIEELRISNVTEKS